MKVRNLSFFLKESFSNILSNKWMSAASTIIVFTTLYVVGVFFLIATNVDKISFNVEDQPMDAFTIDKADQKMADAVKKKIEQIDGVKSVQLVNKQQGLNELKEKYENYEDLFNGMSSDFLSYKFVIYLNDAHQAQKVKTAVENLVEIKKVNYAQETMDKVLKITRIVRTSSYVLTVILGVISLFIIIYTIKLTVFSRRREINIMKYVGATDWFIRWPFVIEGIFIGICGAVFAAISVIISYDYVFKIFNSISSSIIQLMPIQSGLKWQLFWVFLLVGSIIGSLGSIISVKKYLYV